MWQGGTAILRKGLTYLLFPETVPDFLPCFKFAVFFQVSVCPLGVLCPFTSDKSNIKRMTNMIIMFEFLGTQRLLVVAYSGMFHCMDVIFSSVCLGYFEFVKDFPLCWELTTTNDFPQSRKPLPSPFPEKWVLH